MTTKKYEFRVETIAYYYADDLEHLLNKRGENGWTCASISIHDVIENYAKCTSCTVVLQREITE